MQPLPLSPKHRRLALTLLWSGLLWILLAGLYSRGLNFPFWYHWDEESKALQVIDGTRNLNHPQLLLNTTTLVERLVRPGSQDVQHVTILGRLVSVGFAAGAVVLLAQTATGMFGPWAGALTALLVGLHPRVFILAHFFKEDTALMFGWAAVLRAALLVRQHPTRRTALLLGIAAGLAVSGKYIGIIATLGALAMLLPKPTRRLLAPALAGILLTVILINLQAMLQLSHALERIQWEVHHQLNNETSSPPPWVLWWRDTGWVGSLLFAASMPLLLRHPRRDPAVLWLAFGTAGVYFLILSGITRMVGRYMLMVEVNTWWLIALLLGCGLSSLKTSASSTRRAATGLAILAACLWRLQTFPPAWRNFHTEDSRVATAKALESLARPGDRLMMDLRVLFPGGPHANRTIHGWIPAYPLEPILHWREEDGDDLFETLLERGFTLVAISPDDVQRYLDLPGLITFGQFRDIQWRVPFYQRLFAEAELILETNPQASSFVAPHLKVFRIAPPPDAP